MRVLDKPSPVEWLILENSTKTAHLFSNADAEGHRKSICKSNGGFYLRRIHKRKNKRCGLGGFAVKKTATCNEWEIVY